MYDHERSLVKRLAGQPFALIGVNTDSDLATIRQTVKEKELTWRSFYDGDSGPIVEQYGIRSFPTIMLIDHNGIVRDNDAPSRPDELDAAIDQLLAEVEPK